MRGKRFWVVLVPGRPQQPASPYEGDQVIHSLWIIVFRINTKYYWCKNTNATNHNIGAEEMIMMICCFISLMGFKKET